MVSREDPVINLDEIYVGDIVKWIVGVPSSYIILSVGKQRYINTRNVTVLDERGRLHVTFLSEFSGCEIWHDEQFHREEQQTQL